MKYSEWVKELKENLRGIPATERQRVLDYYAEAYADRLATGYTEEQILEDFGSPCAAARAIYGNDGGSCSLSSRLGNGSGKTLDIDVSAGSADIYFIGA